MCFNGGKYLCHPDIETETPELYFRDGVHLSDVGYDFMLLRITDLLDEYGAEFLGRKSLYGGKFRGRQSLSAIVHGYNIVMICQRCAGLQLLGLVDGLPIMFVLFGEYVNQGSPSHMFVLWVGQLLRFERSGCSLTQWCCWAR